MYGQCVRWGRALALAAIGVVLVTPARPSAWGISDDGSRSRGVERILAPSFNVGALADNRANTFANEPGRHWLSLTGLSDWVATGAGVLLFWLCASRTPRMRPQIKGAAQRPRGPPLH
jgi:hypothetical protein